MERGPIRWGEHRMQEPKRPSFEPWLQSLLKNVTLGNLLNLPLASASSSVNLAQGYEDSVWPSEEGTQKLCDNDPDGLGPLPGEWLTSAHQCYSSLVLWQMKAADQQFLNPPLCIVSKHLPNARHQIIQNTQGALSRNWEGHSQLDVNFSIHYERILWCSGHLSQ